MINKKFFWNRLLQIKLFFIIVYLVGTIGLIIPYSFPLFLRLTFLTLIVSSIGLFIFHQAKNIKKDIIIFAVIFLLGFTVEVLGVNTGLVFGSYQYGETLGIKLFNTPLLIGLNWLFLTYTALSISSKITKKSFWQLIIAPTLMLGYDIVMEQLASIMDMWTWSNSLIPIKNYIAWWLIGLLFAGILKRSKINTNNPLALVLFLCQFLFFVVLLIYNIILK